MRKTKIHITDQDGKEYDLEKDLIFGCAMDHAGEGACQCMSFYVGGGIANKTASGSIADGIVKTFHEAAAGDERDEIGMLCVASNVINMRIHDLLKGGNEDGGN